jgi:hypothetical protein
MEYPYILKKPADPEPCDLPGLDTDDILPTINNLSAVRPKEAGNQMKYGCFAGTVGPNQGGDVTGPERNIHPVYGSDSVK